MFESSSNRRGPNLRELGAGQKQTDEEQIEIACIFRGLKDTTPYDAVYGLIKEFLSFESSIEQVLKILSDNIDNSKFILDMYGYDGNNFAYRFDFRELTPISRANLQEFFDPETVPKTSMVIDLIRGLIKNKTLAEIASSFANYCGEYFNDSVLSQKWQQVSDSLSQSSKIQNEPDDHDYQGKSNNL